LQIGDFGLAENFDENAQADWGKRQSLRRTGTKGFFAPVRLFPPFQDSKTEFLPTVQEQFSNTWEKRDYQNTGIAGQ
jgi:hypothetical protein